MVGGGRGERPHRPCSHGMGRHHGRLEIRAGGRATGIWDQPPSEGSLPPRTAAASPACSPASPARHRNAGSASGRDMATRRFSRDGAADRDAAAQDVLLRGPLHAAGTAFAGIGWPTARACVAGRSKLVRGHGHRPDEHYIGGSAPCIEALVGDKRLEAYPVTSTRPCTGRAMRSTRPRAAATTTSNHTEPFIALPRPSPVTITSRAPRPAPPGDTQRDEHAVLRFCLVASVAVSPSRRPRCEDLARRDAQVIEGPQPGERLRLGQRECPRRR